MKHDDAKDAIDYLRACVLANISRGAMWDVEMCTKAVALIERQQSENARLAAEAERLTHENIGSRRCEEGNERSERVADALARKQKDQISALKAEVDRLTPKPMTLEEVARTLERLGYKGVEWNANKVCVFSYGGNGITLGGMEARYIAQGLLRDAGPIAVREPDTKGGS